MNVDALIQLELWVTQSRRRGVRVYQGQRRAPDINRHYQRNTTVFLRMMRWLRDNDEESAVRAMENASVIAGAPQNVLVGRYWNYGNVRVATVPNGVDRLPGRFARARDEDHRRLIMGPDDRDAGYFRLPNQNKPIQRRSIVYPLEFIKRLTTFFYKASDRGRMQTRMVQVGEHRRRRNYNLWPTKMNLGLTHWGFQGNKRTQFRMPWKHGALTRVAFRNFPQNEAMDILFKTLAIFQAQLVFFYIAYQDWIGNYNADANYDDYTHLFDGALNSWRTLSSLRIISRPERDNLNWGVVRGGLLVAENPIPILRGQQSYMSLGSILCYHRLVEDLESRGKILTSNPKTQRWCLLWAIRLAVENRTYSSLSEVERRTWKQWVYRCAKTLGITAETSLIDVLDLMEELGGRINMTKNLHLRVFDGTTGEQLAVWRTPGYCQRSLSRKRSESISTEPREINIYTVLGHAYAEIDNPTPDQKLDDWQCYEGIIVDPEDYKPYRNVRLLTYDIETTAVEMKAYAIGLYDSETKVYHSWVGLDCIKQFLIRLHRDVGAMPRGTKVFIYAHNGGKFDIYYLIKVLLEDVEIRRYWVVDETLDVNGGLGSVKAFAIYAQGHSRPVIFRDSFLYLSSSLKSICAQFGTETQKGDVDHEKVTLESFEEEWERQNIGEYLKKDCIALSEVLVQFHALAEQHFHIDMYRFTTIAGMARGSFFKNYYDQKTFPLCRPPFTEDLEIRQAYLGGRNEAFVLGEVEGPVYYYDFTSLYPTVQIEDMPYGVPEDIEATELEAIKILLGDPDGVVALFEVIVAHGSTWSGIPGIGIRHAGRLVFPDFYHDTPAYLWSFEIAEFIKQGEVYVPDLDLGAGNVHIKIVRGWKWPSAPYFKEAIETAFQLKYESPEGPTRQVAKIFINSTYGFFGFNPLSRKGNYIFRKKLPPELDEYNNVMKTREINGYSVTRMKVTAYPEYVCVPIAACITARARLKLYQLFKEIEGRGGRVLYCDTDSVITDLNLQQQDAYPDLYRKYFSHKWLGSLKNEKGSGTPHFSGVIINGAKFYSLRDENNKTWCSKIKGYYRKTYTKTKDYEAKEIVMHPTDHGDDDLSYNDHKKISEGWTLVQRPWRFRTNTWALFGEDFAQLKKEWVEIRLGRLNEKGEERYSKRNVKADGTTEPLKV